MATKENKKSVESELLALRQELARVKEEYEEFAYIVSHDLGAPLRSIEGFSKIIAQKYGDSFDEKTLRHFDFIIEGADKSKAMLAALLEFSRLNTEPGAFVDCDCLGLAREVEKSLASEFEASGAVLHCVNLPRIFADKKQLSLLFYHLIHNALRFRKKGEAPKIVLSCKESEDFWRFTIADKGIGVEQKVKNTIFKVLRRGVSNKDFPGMGMGLALAKKIVQRHGGSIALDESYHDGAAFHFTIAKNLAL